MGARGAPFPAVLAWPNDRDTDYPFGALSKRGCSGPVYGSRLSRIIHRD
jgi:hypothetical protein